MARKIKETDNMFTKTILSEFNSYGDCDNLIKECFDIHFKNTDYKGDKEELFDMLKELNIVSSVNVNDYFQSKGVNKSVRMISYITRTLHAVSELISLRVKSIELSPITEEVEDTEFINEYYFNFSKKHRDLLRKLILSGNMEGYEVALDLLKDEYDLNKPY